jgi:hypothetical protein
MKKILILISLLALASVLIAAVPAGDNKSGLCYNPVLQKWVPCNGHYKIKYPGQGEPRMEKVAFFGYVEVGPSGVGHCDTGGVWSAGCYTWYYCVKSYKMPVGCNFRYQY